MGCFQSICGFFFLIVLQVQGHQQIFFPRCVIFMNSLNHCTMHYFSHLRFAVIGQDCIVFVDDFSVSKTPSSNGRKFYISTPTTPGVYQQKDKYLSISICSHANHL